MQSVRSNSFCTSLTHWTDLPLDLEQGIWDEKQSEFEQVESESIVTQLDQYAKKAAYPNINYSLFFSFASLKCWRQH